MRKGIHPVQKVCKVKCACGNEFEVKSTKDEIQLESCNKCHSFYMALTLTTNLLLK